MDDVLLRRALQRSSSVNYSCTQPARRPSSAFRKAHLSFSPARRRPANRIATPEATTQRHPLNSHYVLFLRACSRVTSQVTHSDSGLEVGGGDDGDGSSLLTELPLETLLHRHWSTERKRGQGESAAVCFHFTAPEETAGSETGSSKEELNVFLSTRRDVFIFSVF